MTTRIDEKELKQGTLGMVITAVDGVRDILRRRAVRIMDSGTLDSSQRERLGKTMLDLETAFEDIKREQGIAESVRTARAELSSAIDDMVNRIIFEGVK
jgi:hypothetical protein